MADKETASLKAKLLKKKKPTPIKPEDFLSSGSTLLNLAVSGRTNGCFVKGKYHFIVGDSKSAKTFLSLTCLAEAARNPNFEKYRFIFDDVEGGALMDKEKYFGKKVASRLESPSTNASHMIEEFYYNVDNAIEDGRPFIYILDSMDSLSSENEESKYQEHKKAFYAEKETAGSMGDGKAKKNASGLRRLMPLLRKSGSILIIINQTRDNIGFGFEKKTRSGGKALRFYATTEWWSSLKGEIKKKIRGKDREVGVNVKIDIKKNRITGKEPTIEIPIYHSSGFDDTGSLVNYLIEEGHWTKNKQGFIECPEWECNLRFEDLIAKIEEEELEKELKIAVKGVWDEIQEASEVKRKKRYE